MGNASTDPVRLICAATTSTLLSAVKMQEFDGEVEVLVIDSGSSDGSLDIVQSFPSVDLCVVPPPEFGHGKTRRQRATTGWRLTSRRSR